MQTPPRFLRTDESAEYLNLPAPTLKKWRVTKKGPAFSRLGHRLVVYSVNDLDSWIKSNRHAPSSENGGQA